MLAKWRASPATMVRELFGVEPDPWQERVLELFPRRPRLAMKASKGPGKTFVLAMCCINFLLTRPFPNIAATSISYDNLRDGLWKEMSFWLNRNPVLGELFEWQTERIFSKQYPATWFMSARSWPKTANQEQLGNTLAGLHSDYIMFVVDESGSIPPAILMSAEAALSSCVEGHIMQAGNTNTLDGALYEACVRHKHRWEVITINGDPDDPMRSSRIDIEWARELIRDRGREDPFVKLLVLGEWPAASINALIGPDEVEAAMKRQYQQRDIDGAPRIFGVDTADEGDDASVIFPRQGLVAFPPRVLRGVTGEFGAGQISRMSENWPPDAIFVDNTGGYGGTWRAALKALNCVAIPVGFAEEPNDRQYANRRAEMYFEAVKWIRDGGALPNVPEMVAELTQTTYTIVRDRLLLEPKKLVKAKIGRSPDRTDAFCLCFAQPVATRSQELVMPAMARRTAYDPFESMVN
jgi:phage terminase large subunit